MFEKVNPSHPDKVADRIAGALVDLAYAKERDPRIAVEVLIGHGICRIIAETSVSMLDAGTFAPVADAVHRIAGEDISIDYREYPQDARLAENQADGVRCGDNGIFRGAPVTDEQRRLSRLMRDLYETLPCDGKAILDDEMLTICQSNAGWGALSGHPALRGYSKLAINPLGEWTGGTDVDTGATNRKLGSDMGDAVTGGGLHGKDLSKADVSVNVCCHILAQNTRGRVEACCSIGDREVTFRGENLRREVPITYASVVEIARSYIEAFGGFERFAEWGLI